MRYGPRRQCRWQGSSVYIELRGQDAKRPGDFPAGRNLDFPAGFLLRVGGLGHAHALSKLFLRQTQVLAPGAGNGPVAVDHHGHDFMRHMDIAGILAALDKIRVN